MTTRQRCSSTTVFLAFFILLLSGCGARQLDQAIEQGAVPVVGEGLQTLVVGNTLHMEGRAYTAEVEIFEDGTIRAVNSEHDKESGRWHIDENDRLCIKFRKWNHGDTNCMTVYKSGEVYRQFTANGVQTGTFTVSAGTAPAPGKNRSAGGKKQQRPPARPPSPPETTAGTDPGAAEPAGPTPLPFPARQESAGKDLPFFYRDTARDCPGCNLAKITLAGASLVRAKLAGANLKEANLKGADLQLADLKGADLRKADLAGANLAGADLAGADLTGALLRGANFRRANLKGALIDETSQADTAGSLR